MAKFLSALALALFISVAAPAVTTDQFDFTDVARIGVIMGSFDPPHRDHQLTIEWISRQPGIDGVLVLPNSYAPHKPDVSPYEHRWNMISILYKDHPKIIIPTLEDGLKLGSRGIVRSITRKFTQVQVVGYIGEDLANSLLKFSLLRMYWPADEWQVVGRSADASSGVTIAGKTGLSSSKLRRDLEGHREFLNSTVFEYIKAYGIYSPLLSPQCREVFN